MTSLISIVTSLSVVTVNLAVLLAGYGIVPLVAAITAVRLLSYFAYWKMPVASSRRCRFASALFVQAGFAS